MSNNETATSYIMKIIELEIIGEKVDGNELVHIDSNTNPNINNKIQIQIFFLKKKFPAVA